LISTLSLHDALPISTWALEPISIHLSYSSRISSFWAVVKCPRLEERDGTSKDITDFSPRQYCQITVTRQPDTEGAHRCFDALSLFRRFFPPVPLPPADTGSGFCGHRG